MDILMIVFYVYFSNSLFKMTMFLLFLLLLFDFGPMSKVLMLSNKFWQISDLHVDPFYSLQGDAFQMCHSDNRSTATDAPSTGEYGNYSCDAPYALVKSALENMRFIYDDPDFILWTGDASPHYDDPRLQWDGLFSILKNLTLLIHDAFPDTLILPALGNHDTFPNYEYPEEGEGFYGRYLDRALWSYLIPASAHATFSYAGYYSTNLSASLIAIILNTNLYLTENPIGSNASDPGGQFTWLEDQLQLAEEEDMHVYIAAHSPPGFFERNTDHPFFNEKHAQRYIDIVTRFSHVIVSQFYGHLHTDSFRVFPSGKNGHRSVGFVAPSVSPWHSSYKYRGNSPVNPSVRLYDYDFQSAMVTNYYQYYLNLTTIDRTLIPSTVTDTITDTTTIPPVPSPEWTLLYDFNKAYNVHDAGYESLTDLILALSENDTLFEKYYSYNTVGYNNKVVCGDICKVEMLCSIISFNVNDLTYCKSHVHDELYLWHVLYSHASVVSGVCETQQVVSIDACRTIGLVTAVTITILTIASCPLLIFIFMKRKKNLDSRGKLGDVTYRILPLDEDSD